MSVASGENNTVAVDTTATNLDQVIIDNSAGTAQVYLRIWALATGSVTPGTTAPMFILTAGAGESVEYSFAPAPVIETALTAQLVQTSGYSAAGTAVTWNVTITFLTHD
jgi:hypothetical protein